MTGVAKFKSGYRKLHKLDAEAVFERLSKIQKARGALEPKVVVEDGASEDSPLYPAFTHDDVEAARQYRMEEARRLLRSIVIVRTHDDDPDEAPPAFVSVTVRRGDEEVRGYQPIRQVISVASERMQALREAASMLAGLERRYRHLTGEELEPVRRAREHVESALETPAS